MENKSLRGLVVCRNFLNDSVIKALLAVQEQGDNPFGKHEAAAVLLERAEQLGLSGNILRQYFLCNSPLRISSMSISSTTMSRLSPKSMAMSRLWKRLS